MTKEEAIAILKYNSNVIHKTINGETDPNEVEALDMAIKALEQEPRKGHWLAVRTKDDTHEMTCSCCGYVVAELINRRITEETALEYLKDRIDENKFCPNCGAGMREVEE